MMTTRFELGPRSAVEEVSYHHPGGPQLQQQTTFYFAKYHLLAAALSRMAECKF